MLLKSERSFPMANKTLFSSITSMLPRATTQNEAGGAAYALAPKHALAQLAATGCFGNTYYAMAETQLDELRKLIDQVDDNVYLAKLAVYARERAYMKDMPAALARPASSLARPQRRSTRDRPRVRSI